MSPPRGSQHVWREMQALVSTLIQHGMADDQNFPFMRQLSAREWEVSFDGAEFVSIALGDIDYSEIHEELSEKRSYSIKLIDAGLLQMMYRFDGEELTNHRLAFYPSPKFPSFRHDPESYLRDDLYVDIVSRRLVPFPLRFDFDRAAAVDVAHPHCHLTLGDVKGCRIPVSSPITPRRFVEFVLRNFYQTDDHEFVSVLPGHLMNFAATITRNELQIVHVTVPT